MTFRQKIQVLTIIYYFEGGLPMEQQKVNVIIDENGKSIVLINDIRFKTRRKITYRYN